MSHTVKDLHLFNWRMTVHCGVTKIAKLRPMRPYLFFFLDAPLTAHPA
jgi:hypothetical protein